MKSGDRCEKCETGRLGVANSTRRGDWQVQYLRCTRCGHRPAGNKVVRPAEDIRRRFATT